MHHLSNWQRIGLSILVICMGLGLLDAKRQIQIKRDQFDGVFVACMSSAQFVNSVHVDCSTMFSANASLGRKDWLALGERMGILLIIACSCAWSIARIAHERQAGNPASNGNQGRSRKEASIPPIANTATVVGSQLSGYVIIEATAKPG